MRGLLNVERRVIRAVSDWHVGDGSKADEFRSRDAAGLRFLQKCKDDGVLVVYVGDTLDIWQSSVRKVRKAHPDIWAAIETSDHVYLLGNHDYYVDNESNHIFNTVRYLFTTTGLFLHGDEFDRWNRRGAVTGKIVTKVANVLEYIYPNIDNIKFWRDEKDYNYSVARLAHDLGLDTVVYGHTHTYGHWGVMIEGDIVHVHNTGAPKGIDIPYIEISEGVASQRIFT